MSIICLNSWGLEKNAKNVDFPRHQPFLFTGLVILQDFKVSVLLEEFFLKSNVSAESFHSDHSAHRNIHRKKSECMSQVFHKLFLYILMNYYQNCYFVYLESNSIGLAISKALLILKKKKIIM